MPARAALQLNAQVKAATRELTLAFITQILGGTAGAIDRWSERHRPIVARFVPAATR